MRAVITVIGKEMVGSLVTQSILQDLFAMIMLVDLEKATVPFNELVDQMTALGEQEGLKIHVMHEDIFNSMHRI